MGQKVNPIGMRVGIMKSWPGEWYAKDQRTGADFFVEDVAIRNMIEKEFVRAGIAKVVIRKTLKEVEVIIFASKVGVLMGKWGERIKAFEQKMQKKLNKTFKITVKEVRNPELSAKIMAEFIATQLESRMPYRRVAKNALSRIMDRGANGAKIQIGWRLWGADMARSEKFIEGRVSLQTFRSDVDYHYMQAMTKYGVLWIKVWIEKKSTLGPKKSKKRSINLD